jgi:hypothetical protein
LSDAAYIEAFESSVRHYQDAKARQSASGGDILFSRRALCASVDDVAALERSVSPLSALVAPASLPGLSFSTALSIEQSMADLAASLRAPSVAPASTTLLRDAGVLASQLAALVSEVKSLNDDMWVWFWDNGASVNMTRHLSLLVDVQPLSHPFRVGGAVGGALLTHVGRLPFLPPEFSRCFYSAELSVNLLSLNSLQRLGGKYESTGLDSLTISAPDGAVMDVSKQLPNNLNVVSLSLLAAAYPDLTPPAASAFPGIVHLNVEQRERMDRAEALHRGRAGHASDDVLCEALANGEFSWAEITGRDVRLNRQHRGPCPQCAQGKLRNKPMPLSISQPAESVGSAIYFDCHELSSTSPGNNKWAIRAIDEFSGDRSVTGSPSKSATSLYEALLYLVHTRYNAYGHRTDFFVSDPERSLLPVVAMLGRVNIRLTLIDPGQHGQRIESSIGKDDACIRALEAGLPMVWPAALEIFMLKFMADCKNALPNARSRPSTADILRTGRRRVEHYQFPGLSIGAVCIVQEHDPKRREAARVNERSYKFEDVGELGVLLGFSEDFPGDFDFLLANGAIVPRRVVRPVQVFPPPGFGGYTWKRNTVLHAELASSAGPKLPLDSIAPQLAVQGDLGPSPAISPQGSALPFSVVAPQSPPASSIVTELSVPSFLDQLLLPPGSVSPTESPAKKSTSPAMIDILSPPAVSSPLPAVAPLTSTPPASPSTAVASSPTASASASAAPLLGRGARIPRPNSLFSKDEGYALMPAAKVAVAQPMCECYSAPGFESHMCASCVAATWTTVPFRANSRIAASGGAASQCIPTAMDVLSSISRSAVSVAESPSQPLVSPSNVLSSVLSAAVSVPAQRSSSVKSSPSQVLDALTDSDLFWLSMAEISNAKEVADLQRSNRAAALAAKVAHDAAIIQETASFDTQRADEVTLDEALGYYASAYPSGYAEVPVSGSALAAITRAPSSDLQSVPSTKCKEVPLSSALRTTDYEKLVRMTKAEVDKQQRIRCLGTQAFTRSQLPVGCGIVPAVTFYKDKADGRETCRIAANGKRDSTFDPTVVTSTSVASDGDKMCAIASMQAHCASRGEELHMVSYDIVGGFLRIPRKSSVRLFLFLPPNLPHPLAGMYLEILGALYGLVESNRLFADEVRRVLEKAGFQPAPSSPMTYTAFDPVDRGRKILVPVHVDDFLGLTNDRNLADRLRAALEGRFDELTVDEFCVAFAGFDFDRLSHGPVVVSQYRYIHRVSSVVGIDHMPPVAIPADEEFFRSSTTPADCVPVSSAVYQSLTGHLIQMLKTRDDVRHFVSYLCSKNAHPSEGDYSKAIHILRYLRSTSRLGRVFGSDSTELYAYADAAFGFHENGCSSEAFLLSIGRTNAPFYTVARAQSDVATTPMDSEYYVANASCKVIMHYRQLLDEWGWTPTGPTFLAMDSKTAINLVVAPDITKNARHMLVKHHYIRQLAERKFVRPVHVTSANMRVDILTKYLPPRMFVLARDLLLNVAVMTPLGK